MEQQRRNEAVEQATATKSITEPIEDNRVGDYGLERHKTFGYIGLNNQGATCYLNCLLQCLYHLGPFRHEIERAAAELLQSSSTAAVAAEAKPREAVTVLAELFAQMTKEVRSVGTSKITRLFGWRPSEQQDAHEMLMLLLDRLGRDELFRGKLRQVVRCLDVDEPPSAMAADTTVDVDVASGIRSLGDALGRLCCKELLDGTNRYMSTDHGLQACPHPSVPTFDLLPMIAVHLPHCFMELPAYRPNRADQGTHYIIGV